MRCQTFIRSPGARRVAGAALALVVFLGTPSARAAVVLVLGDSLSAGYGIDVEEGWARLLAERLDPEHEVVNASISGDTTAGGLARLDRVLARHQPDVVLVELGGNDGLRGLPLGVIRGNLTRIVERTRAAGAEVLLLGMRIPPNFGPIYTGRFEAIYRDVAERHDVAWVPFLLEGVAGDPRLMQDDGIHPTAAAQARMLENVWPALERLLEAE